MGFRITITLLTAMQAMIAAYLGFGELVPQSWKIGLVVISAGIAVVLNQLPSWGNAVKAQEAVDAKLPHD